MATQMKILEGLEVAGFGGKGKPVVDATVKYRERSYYIESDGSDSNPTVPIFRSGSPELDVYVIVDSIGGGLTTVNFDVEYCVLPVFDSSGNLDASLSTWFTDPSLTLSLSAPSAGTIRITKLCYAFRLNPDASAVYKVAVWGRG